MPEGWFHVTINTRCSWLHGDPRGFRDRAHRVHSSGDYKSPPPPGEHRGLHRWAQQRSAPVVTIPPELRAAVGEALVAKADDTGFPITTCGVGGQHAHMLVRLPLEPRTAKGLVGRWKQAASHAVRERLPGKVWSDGCGVEPVRSQAHRARVHPYILKHAHEGAWVYSRCADITELPW